MKKSFVLFSALSIFAASAVLAGPPKSGKAVKPTTKVVDVWTCPITGEKITNHKTQAGKPVVVGSYRAHFCCGGCPSAFAKLTEKDKKAKVEVAAKKDAAKKDAPVKKG